MSFDLAVLIGRFQPFHKGHLEVVQNALKEARRLLILVGSANRGRDTRNPFNAAEREALIWECLRDVGLTRDQVEICALDDQPYDMQQWIVGVQAVVADHSDPNDLIALTGHNRDLSCFYLNKFPQWEFFDCKGCSDLTINASDIRETYFERTLGLQAHLLDWLPNATYDFLATFTHTSVFKGLVREYENEVRYREQWGEGPFQTGDAVVIQSGHVLVVERGGEIGKGKLALPGGHLELRETLDQCAVRELFEETRIFEARSPDDYDEAAEKLWPHFRGRERFDDPYRSPRARVITEAFLFKLPDAGRFPFVKGADDAKRAFWLPLSEAKPELMFEDHGFVVQRMTRFL